MPVLRFGVFEVDPDSGEFRKRGFRVRPREQPLRLLLTLIEQAGRVVTREQLRHRLWPEGTFVDFDRGINKAASELRGALGDSASSPRFVETLSKRGYRFVCPIEGSPRAPWVSTSDGFPSDAQRACLTGRYLWNRRTVSDLTSSIGFLEHAPVVCATPDQPAALSGSGLAHRARKARRPRVSGHQFIPAVHLLGFAGLRSSSTRGAPSGEPGTVRPVGPLLPRTRLSLLKPGGARRRGAGTRRLFGGVGIHVGRTAELRASACWRSCWGIDASFRTDRARPA